MEQNENPDELRAMWAEHDQKLETSIRLNRRLLRENYARRAQFAMWRLAAMLGAGSLMMVGVIVWLGAFIRDNLGMPQFVWPAVFLDILAIGALACLNFQIALALKTDYDQPVAVVQKRLVMLRKVRVRYAQGILLSMTLTWTPVFIVAMKAFLGIDVWHSFSRIWLLANILFGLAVVPVGIWILRKLSARLSERFRDELAGRNLTAASKFLADLARFEEGSVSGEL